MNWEILYNYIEGKCDEEELRQLGVWLNENPSNQDFFISFIEEMGAEETVGFDSDVRAEWDSFRKENLESRKKNKSGKDSPAYLDHVMKSSAYMRRSSRNGVLYWFYASADAIVLLLTLIFVVEQSESSTSSTVEKNDSYQEISTVRGQRTNLKLSDGSRVVLNSSSTLRIPEDYGKGTRTLYLKGEAFFEVTHDEENPFLVISHQNYTKDLGTEFTVTAYDSSSIEVAVREGLVSLGRVKKGELQKETVEITPGMLAVFKEVGELTVSKLEYMDTYFGWTEGKLVFRDTPFEDVLMRLERWYDIEFKVSNEVVANSTKGRTLTATYESMPINEVLKVLSISMGISYTREGRTVILNDNHIKSGINVKQ